MSPWYALVWWGSCTGRPPAKVHRSLESARDAADRLCRQHVHPVRVVECPTRAQARQAGIGDELRVVYQA